MPAKELLVEMGFDGDKIVPLDEGYDALVKFGRTSGCREFCSNQDPHPLPPAASSSAIAAARRASTDDKPRGSCGQQPPAAASAAPTPAGPTGQQHLHALAKGLIAGEVQLVDVREPHEVERGMCGAAISFPLSEMRSEDRKVPDKLDYIRPVYLHCARGKRVVPAKDLLIDMGFVAENLVPLAEGYDALATFGRTAGYNALRSNKDPGVIEAMATAGARTTEQRHLHDLAKKLMTGNAQLVDVREPHEVARGMCGAAISFPLSEMRSEDCKVPETIDRERPIYLHCARGKRVFPARDLLIGMGFDPDKVMPLNEGYDALASFGRASGYTTLRSTLDPAGMATAMSSAALPSRPGNPRTRSQLVAGNRRSSLQGKIIMEEEGSSEGSSSDTDSAAGRKESMFASSGGDSEGEAAKAQFMQRVRGAARLGEGATGDAAPNGGGANPSDVVINIPDGLGLDDLVVPSGLSARAQDVVALQPGQPAVWYVSHGLLAQRRRRRGPARSRRCSRRGRIRT